MKKMLTLVIAIAMSLMLGCTAFAEETYHMEPKMIADRTLKVGLVPVVINTSYTMTINGARAYIEDKGYDMELIVEAPAGNTSSVEEQGKIIERMILQGVDAIVLATESDAAMLPYLREAEKANIPVFLFNMSEIDPSNIYYVSSIGYDQYQAGYDIGEWVANHYTEETKVAVLEGYPGIVNDQRMQGFKDAIAKNEKIKIAASQCANWNRADGQNVTESILISNPDINLLYGPFDEMVLGGMVALKERGLKGKVDVVGFGATQDGINSIKAGEMTATIDVMEYYTGYDIIEAVHDYCVLGKDVEKLINRDCVVYDAQNVEEHDDTVFAE